MKIRIGTRGSALALWQAHYIADRLRDAHGDTLATEIVIYKTTGDHILDRPLAEIGGKGLFTKELEVGLEQGEIDLAVHSLKDVPTALPSGMVLGAIPTRGDVRDCLVRRIADDVPMARVGTASLRRACLAQRRWAEASVHSIRGRVETRVGRLHEDGDRRMDGVLLAWAGLLRLEMPGTREDVVFQPLNPDTWIPAVGQGALAIECRDDDASVLELIAPIHHAPTAACVTAERAFLAGVEGDCRVPVGGYATADGPSLRLRAFVGHPDGTAYVEHTALGEDPAALGAAVAAAILAAGGADVLAEVRR
mgnify:CR=1 FL=1